MSTPPETPRNAEHRELVEDSTSGSASPRSGTALSVQDVGAMVSESSNDSSDPPHGFIRPPVTPAERQINDKRNTRMPKPKLRMSNRLARF